MTPIHKLPTYLIRFDGSFYAVEYYTNSQLSLLHTYPYDGSKLPSTGGVLGKSNTDRVQVYVNRAVKYII